jgi:hypothetical protein
MNALGPVDIVHVGLSADHGVVGASSAGHSMNQKSLIVTVAPIRSAAGSVAALDGLARKQEGTCRPIPLPFRAVSLMRRRKPHRRSRLVAAQGPSNGPNDVGSPAGAWLSCNQICGETRYVCDNPAAVEPIDRPARPSSEAHRQGIQVHEREKRTRTGSIRRAVAARRPGEPGWGLLLLVWSAGNVVVATLAWFLASLFLK